MDKRDFKLSRRDLPKLALLTGGATLIGGRNAFGQQLRCLPQQPHDIHLGSGIGVGGEPFPTSPLILNPFTDPLPEPKAMAPTKLADVANWTDRSGASAPPGRNNQDCYGSKHQIWPSDGSR